MTIIIKFIYTFFSSIGKAFYKFIIMPMKKSMFAKCGKHAFIGHGSFFTYQNIYIGNNVSIGMNALLMSTMAKIKINDNVMFGPGVTIITGDHRTDVIGEYMINVQNKLPENDMDVTIESDVWVGCNVTILKGVTIGRGSVVAAGSLVNKDVEPYSIYGGVPAKKLRARFTDEQIDEHEKILLEKTK